MIGALRRQFFHPLWHWAKRDGYNEALKELEHNQWLSAPTLLALQRRKLEALLDFVSRHVPYYRTHIQGIGYSPDQGLDEQWFCRLPILTKAIIRQAADDFVSEDLTANRLVRNSTSGSTGEALRFYTDAQSMPYRAAAQIRSDSWTGWCLGDRVVRLWGAPMDKGRAGAVRGKLHGWVTGDRFLSSYDLTPASMDSYIRTIQRFRPAILVAYPGPLEELARHCRERNASFPSLRAIVSSAETLWPHQREIVENAFGVRIFNRYGSREFAHIASECEAHNGMHVSVDRVHLDIVDDEGQPCPRGELGRLIVTDLDNYGMPMIRYDIGDRGAWADDVPCSCGRGLPRLRLVEGRTMDIVRTPDGGRIGGTYWTLLLRSRPGLKQFQVIQEKINGVTVRYIPDAEFSAETLSFFSKKIKEQCGENFDVHFVETGVIDLTGSGKQRLIVSKIADEPVRARGGTERY